MVNKNTKVGKWELCEWTCKALQSALTPKNIKSGFRKAGSAAVICCSAHLLGSVWRREGAATRSLLCDREANRPTYPRHTRARTGLHPYPGRSVIGTAKKEAPLSTGTTSACGRGRTQARACGRGGRQPRAYGTGGMDARGGRTEARGGGTEACRGGMEARGGGTGAYRGGMQARGAGRKPVGAGQKPVPAGGAGCKLVASVYGMHHRRLRRQHG